MMLTNRSGGVDSVSIQQLERYKCDATPDMFVGPDLCLEVFGVQLFERIEMQ